MRGARTSSSALALAALVAVTMCASRADARPAGPGGLQALVTRVVDGDTLSVLLFTGARVQVRLVGVNAPDLGECYYDATTTRQVSTTRGGCWRTCGRTSTTRFPSASTVAFVFATIAGAGQDLGYQQVLSGRARVARRTFERRPVYLRVERWARSRERTLWGQCHS